MTRLCFGKLSLGFAAVLCLGLLGSPAQAQDSVAIDAPANIPAFGTAACSVNLTNSSDVEGYVLAISFEGEYLTVSNVTAGDIADDAELVVSEIFDEDDGFTLGVVMDATAPFEGQVIAGDDTEKSICDFDVEQDQILDSEVDVDFGFVDGTLNDPLLDNILVVDGQSISIDGTGATSTLETAPDSIFTFGDGSVPKNGTGTAQVLMTNGGPVQGFVCSVSHDAELELVDILIGLSAETVGAEFSVVNVEEGGGTIAVVLDFESPFSGQTIGAGDENEIALYEYRAAEGVDHPTEPDPCDEYEIWFDNGAYGDPALDNVIVIAGLSESPDISDTGIVCLEPGVLEDTEFHLSSTTGAPGDIVELCVSYVEPEDDIQGFSIAMCMPADSEGILTFVEDSWTIDGTIVDEVGAEYVNASYDNDATDGDGVEMTVGILMDALPPFDNQTVPQTLDPDGDGPQGYQALVIGCFQVEISEDAECETCYGVDFCDGVNADETQPVDNIAVIDFGSVGDFLTFSGEICIVADPEFVRGDCNNDSIVNIADAAAILGQQFQGLEVNCEDACDVNNDGRINLADTVFTLTFLFKSGDEPADPYPDQGPDQPDENGEEDDLGCEGGANPCA